jgi:Peptidase A4 family
MKKIVVATLFVFLLFAGLGLTAMAQSSAVASLYRSSATISTNIEGIRTYPAPPANFSALAATDETLAMYGLPPRPDRDADPRAYAAWQRAMTRAKTRVTGSLTPHPEGVLGPARLARKQPAAQSAGASAVPTQYNSLNWSGVANSNTLKKWNTLSSFNRVFSEFNVPVVEQSFDVCGPLQWEVTWNGLDGALDGTVLQGGSSSQASCSNGVQSQNYYAWVEWYPTYPIVEVFAVNPGDDIYVESYSTEGGCNPGNVFVEDETTLSYGTYQLTWQKGPCLIGDSAEIIVERPFGANNVSGWYPLANYIWDFALSWDYTAKGTEFGPGATTTSTLVFTMTDDAEDQQISIPEQEGKYSMFFWDTNCAYTGGCTP